MASSNDFFMRMCKEAQDELASGGEGWKAVDTNTLVLACFGMLANHLTAKLSRPLWFFASTVCAGVIWYIVSHVLGAGN